MDYFSLVKDRKSIRSFKDNAVSEDDQNAVVSFFRDKCHKLLPEIATEVQIFSGTAGDQLEGVIGYQGFAFHAPYYLFILSAKADGMYENAGYIGEDMILKLTEMGLDSCWLSLPADTDPAGMLGYHGDKTTAAVIAFGYGVPEKDTARIDIKSPSDVKVTEREGHIAPKIAEEEMVFQDVYGGAVDWENTVAPSLDQALYSATLAPSFLNLQEYRYIMGNGKLLLLSRSDEDTTEWDQKLDLGATMLNFAVCIEQSIYPDVAWKLGKPADLWELGDTRGFEAAAYCNI